MRTVWIEPADITGGHCEPGRLVQAARPLSDWCLRTDDGAEPIPTGTPLEIIEQRPWGKAMAREAHGAAAARDDIDPDCEDCQDAVYEAVAQSPVLQAVADAVMAKAMGGWRPSAVRAEDEQKQAPMPSLAFGAAT